VRRVHLSSRALRFELGLARLACVVMVGFAVGPCLWVAGGGAGPRDLFHIGAIDVAGMTLMCGALTVAWRSSRCAREAAADIA
jgi:hypothetical protein